ncbi:MAG: hypothetical protein IH892_19445 [Planctomycetes bacterium]|nr:hypothetical protein [Planctomycetota bacterium]
MSATIILSAQASAAGRVNSMGESQAAKSIRFPDIPDAAYLYWTPV